jgi:CheY-like chemotaxis protein
MKNILIASSSASFIERNSTLLRRSDFNIWTADSASTVVTTVNSQNIDLALFDISLSDVSGEELTSRLVENTPNYRPVILLVCHDSEEDFSRLKPCGADALISRPIKPLQLIKTVGQFLTVQLVRSRRVSLRVKVISKKDAAEFFCISHNISITGLLIETEYSLEVGSYIICQFSIPNSIDVEVEGEIVRTARTMDGAHQYGIHFLNLGRAIRHEIDQYISSVVRGEVQIS